MFRSVNRLARKGAIRMAVRDKPGLKVNPGEITLHIPGNLDSVPVRRVAEFVPASFTSIDTADENDILNYDDARWYRVNGEIICLTINDGETMLQFSVPALLALCARMESMSDTTLDTINPEHGEIDED